MILHVGFVFLAILMFVTTFDPVWAPVLVYAGVNAIEEHLRSAKA